MNGETERGVNIVPKSLEKNKAEDLAVALDEVTRSAKEMEKIYDSTSVESVELNEIKQLAEKIQKFLITHQM